MYARVYTRHVLPIYICVWKGTLLQSRKFHIPVCIWIAVVCKICRRNGLKYGGQFSPAQSHIVDICHVPHA